MNRFKFSNKKVIRKFWRWINKKWQKTTITAVSITAVSITAVSNPFTEQIESICVCFIFEDQILYFWTVKYVMPFREEQRHESIQIQWQELFNESLLTVIFRNQGAKHPQLFTLNKFGLSNRQKRTFTSFTLILVFFEEDSSANTLFARQPTN